MVIMDCKSSHQAKKKLTGFLEMECLFIFGLTSKILTMEENLCPNFSLFTLLEKEASNVTCQTIKFTTGLLGKSIVNQKVIQMDFV